MSQSLFYVVIHLENSYSIAYLLPNIIATYDS